MKKWIYFSGIFLLLIGGFVNHYYQATRYSDFSVKQNEMCLDHLDSVPGKIELCSHIVSEANEAFSAASSGELLSFIVIVNAFIIVSGWALSLEMRLEKVENRTDA